MKHGTWNYELLKSKSSNGSVVSIPSQQDNDILSQPRRKKYDTSVLDLNGGWGEGRTAD